MQIKNDAPVVAIRRKRLRQWIDEKYGGTQANFVSATGINQGELSSLLKDKSFGEKKARAIEKALGLSPLWLDRESDDALTPGDAEFLSTVGQGIKERALPEHIRQTILTLITSSPKKGES